MENESKNGYIRSKTSFPFQRSIQIPPVITSPNNEQPHVPFFFSRGNNQLIFTPIQSSSSWYVLDITLPSLWCGSEKNAAFNATPAITRRRLSSGSTPNSKAGKMLIALIIRSNLLFHGSLSREAPVQQCFVCISTFSARAQPHFVVSNRGAHKVLAVKFLKRAF